MTVSRRFYYRLGRFEAQQLHLRDFSAAVVWRHRSRRRPLRARRRLRASVRVSTWSYSKLPASFDLWSMTRCKGYFSFREIYSILGMTLSPITLCSCSLWLIWFGHKFNSWHFFSSPFSVAKSFNCSHISPITQTCGRRINGEQVELQYYMVT